MLRHIILFFLLSINLSGQAQFSKIYSSYLNHLWFNCDADRNVYTITGTAFHKYQPPYSSSISYDLQKEGIPDFIDINNPNEIVLFFQESHRIILLDSNLIEIIRPFHLEEIGIFDISMVFASNDQSLWFYNYIKNSLTKLNKSFAPVVRSLNLNTYFQAPNGPNYIVTFENKFYLNIPTYGILVLGKNGEFITAYQLPGLIDFQIDEKAIYFYRDRIIYCYNYRTLKIKKIYVPDEPGIINAWFFDNEILVLKKDEFSVYTHDINPIDIISP